MENVFLTKLTELMELNDVSRKDLANSIDVSYRAVSDYFNKNVIPRRQTLEKIAQLFNVPVSYLVPLDGEPSSKNLGIPFYFEGMTKESFHDLDEDNAGFLPITFHDAPYIAAFVIRGNSMFPDYPPDSIALIDFDIKPDLPASLSLFGMGYRINGCYLLKYKNDYLSSSVKLIRDITDSGLLFVESYNPDFPARAVKPSEIQILAKVVGKLDDLDFMSNKKFENEKPLVSSLNKNRQSKRKIIFTEWSPTHLELEDIESLISHNDNIRMACSEYMSDFFNRHPSHELIKFEFKSQIQKVHKKNQEVLFGIRIWYSYPA